MGLEPLNVRVGVLRNGDINGSLSFNTLLTGSPTSSAFSSSDLDTEVSLSSMCIFLLDFSRTFTLIFNASDVLILKNKVVI